MIDTENKRKLYEKMALRKIAMKAGKIKIPLDKEIDCNDCCDNCNPADCPYRIEEIVD